MQRCVVCNSKIPNQNFICIECQKDPFRVEKARNFLAKINQLNLLKETYSKKYAEIENINTSIFWDKIIIERKRDEENSPITKDRIKTVSRIIKQLKGKVLDIGFGYGFIEKKLSGNKEIELYGIDISPVAVNSIKKNIKGTFKLGSILNIPFKNEFFNIVIVLEVLEHISPQNTLNAIREIKRVLKNGGYLIVSVPLNEGLEDKYKKGYNPNGHVRVYSPELIKKELELFSFKIKKEVRLTAFKNLYSFKKFLSKLFPNHWKENNIIIVAQKE